MPIFDRPLAPGFPGIKKTVLTIIALIQRGSDNRRVRRIARVLAKRSSSRKDFLVQVFRFVGKRIRFEPDPGGIELVQTAFRTLRRRAGDCDDYTVLTGALLRARGIPSRVRIIRTGRHKMFNHVFIEARYRGRWKALDATLIGRDPGSLPPAIESKTFFVGGGK